MPLLIKKKQAYCILTAWLLQTSYINLLNKGQFTPRRDATRRGATFKIVIHLRLFTTQNDTHLIILKCPVMLRYAVLCLDMRRSVKRRITHYAAVLRRWVRPSKKALWLATPRDAARRAARLSLKPSWHLVSTIFRPDFE